MTAPASPEAFLADPRTQLRLSQRVNAHRTPLTACVVATSEEFGVVTWRVLDQADVTGTARKAIAEALAAHGGPAPVLLYMTPGLDGTAVVHVAVVKRGGVN